MQVALQASLSTKTMETDCVLSFVLSCSMVSNGQCIVSICQSGALLTELFRSPSVVFIRGGWWNRATHTHTQDYQDGEQLGFSSPQMLPVVGGVGVRECLGWGGGTLGRLPVVGLTVVGMMKC